MKIKVLIASAMLLFSASTAFCGIKEELSFIESQINTLQSKCDSKEKPKCGKLSRELLISTLDRLEENVLCSINRYETKLEKYKEKLQNGCAQNDEESAEDNCNIGLLKKIESTQKKIDNHKEMLFSIQMLKMRMNLS